MKKMVMVFICLMAVALCQSAQSLRFTASSKHQRIVTNLGVADFYCNTDSVIERCQFKIWDDYYKKELPLIDSTNLTQQWTNFTGSDYKLGVRNFNTDLTQGRCAMSVMVWTTSYEYFLVGCRIRAALTDWTYKYISLFAQKLTTYSDDLVIQPDEVMSAPLGSEVSVTCSTTSSAGCTFRDANQRTEKWSDSRNYCRNTRPVTEDNSRAMIWYGSDTYMLGTNVVATMPPSSVNLQLTEQEYGLGEMLEATCKVSEARPQPNITWYLGGDPLGRDDVKEVQDDRWIWSWDSAGRTQILRRQVRAEDDGKTLTCEASHVGLRQTKGSSTTIHLATTSVEETSSTSTSNTTTTSTTTYTVATASETATLETTIDEIMAFPSSSVQVNGSAETTETITVTSVEYAATASSESTFDLMADKEKSIQLMKKIFAMQTAVIVALVVMITAGVLYCARNKYKRHHHDGSNADRDLGECMKMETKQVDNVYNEIDAAGESK